MDKIKLYKPHALQKPVHKACNDSDTFFITVNAGRQSGKTALSQQQGIFWALDNPKVLVYWVSPTQSQVGKVYKQMLDMLIKTPVIQSYKGSMGDTEIFFKNGSMIKFRSAAQEDTLRGETIDYLIVDEGAFIKESVFNEILLPMLNVRGKKCLVISTPKSKNWFFRQFQRGKAGNNTYRSFKFTSMDNPYASPLVIDIAREALPASLFAQEYEGVFIDSTAIFENLNELACLKVLDKPASGRSYWMGVDIALKDDYTVITIIDDKDEVVYYNRFNHVTAPQLKQYLIDDINLWKPKKILIEENNQGLPIIDDLKHIHKITNIVGFKTTSTSKQTIVNNLINAFSSKKIKVPNDDIYRSELETFTMTISPTGQPKFAASDGFHDDIPMSLCIAWECVNKYKYNGTYNFF